MTAPPAGALEACLALRRAGKEASFVMSCADLVATHGPALLAALRLREGCEGLVARIEREADAHTYFADNADLRMTAGDHEKRAAQLTTIRDDLARVLEEGE